MDVVGVINFDDWTLNVYKDLDEPLFLAVEVAKLIDYSNGRTADMLELTEEDEKILINTSSGLTRQQRRVMEREAQKVSGIVGNTKDIGQGGKPNKWFVTELGLYNVLSQSRKPVARKWRRVVHSSLILLRKQKEMSVVDQFDEWHTLLDDLYIDPETGVLMQSVTVQGGDVEQIPYSEGDERSLK